jgi:glycosyltransferase involved in cell wall biosynthesis
MTDSPAAALRATVLITTRNRGDRLRQALQSCLAQTAAPEILVLDDASGDGTYELVRREFPQVRIERSATSLGCPAQRNRGVALASGDVVVCLDDDAWFPSPHTVQQTLDAFDDPRIGVVTIPYINVRRESWVRQREPSPGRWVTGTFAGGASAVRRSAFLACGGYPDFREHGEETDLAIRLLDRGLVVRLGGADHVVHDEAAVRKTDAAFAASSRNHLLTVWRTVPWPYLPGRWAFVAGKVIAVGIRGRRPGAALGGVMAAARACAAGREVRAPVRRRTHVLSRRLMRKGPLPMTEAMEAAAP